MQLEEEIQRNNRLLRLNFQLTARNNLFGQAFTALYLTLFQQPLDHHDLDQDDIQSYTQRMLQHLRQLPDQKQDRWQSLYLGELRQSKSLKAEVIEMEEENERLRTKINNLNHEMEQLSQQFAQLFEMHHLKMKVNRIEDYDSIIQLLHSQKEASSLCSSAVKTSRSIKASPAKHSERSTSNCEKGVPSQILERLSKRECEEKEQYFKQVKVMAQMKDQLWRELQEEKRRTDQLRTKLRQEQSVNAAVRKSRLQQLEYLIAQEN